MSGSLLITYIYKLMYLINRNFDKLILIVDYNVLWKRLEDVMGKFEKCEIC